MRIFHIIDTNGALIALNNAGFTGCFKADNDSIVINTQEKSLAYAVVRDFLEDLIVLMDEDSQFTYYEGKNYGEDLVEMRTSDDYTMDIRYATPEQRQFLSETLLLAGLVRHPKARVKTNV